MHQSAQDIQFFNEFKQSLNEEYKSEIDEIEDDLLSAGGLHNKGKELLINNDTSGGLKLYRKASDLFTGNYRIVYTAFRKGLDDLSLSLTGQKKEYVDYMKYLADDYFRKSIADRFYAEKSSIDSQAVELFSNAHLNEFRAVTTQCRTFAIITGRLESNYEIPGENISKPGVFNNSVTDNFEEHNFTVKGVSMPKTFTYYRTDIVYVDADENGNNSKNVTNNNTHSVDNKEQTEYRIQIGTSILPANQGQISRLNSTDLEVKTYKSEVYYKYTIGSFSTFQEAKNFRNAFGLSNTYIVKYKSGNEVQLYLRDYEY
jgi:hypothetical protein